MIFLRNYALIFLLSYLILFVSKIFFFFYLDDFFLNFSFSEKLYAVAWGYKFDFAISGVIALLATLLDAYKKVTLVSATLLLTSLFIFQISDIFYFYDASRHVGYEILDTLTDAGSLLNTALMQHTTATISALLISGVLFIGLFLYLNRFIEPIMWNRYTIFKKLFLVLLTIFFIRGMFNHIPLNPWQSNQIGDTKLASIALNGTYNMLRAVVSSKAQLKPLRLPKYGAHDKNSSLLKLYDGYVPVEKKLEKPNIVFLFLESWSYVKLSPQVTPFLFEIMDKSVRANAMLANGHRTTEGIFATLTSFQNPLGKSVAKNQLQDFDYESIIDLLNSDGYESIFFQGTAKETSGTGSLAQKLGFHTSYGKHDIVERKYKENSWGVFDQDLYEFVQKTLKQSKKPFVVGINGATTHDDMIPEDEQLLKLTDNIKQNKKLNAFHSSDSALRDFVTTMEQTYPNTLFVFFADHCGIVNGSAYENYLIPFALYHPKLQAKNYDIIMSQRDISPTIVDLVYGDYRHYLPNSSGKSLFSDQKFFADYFHNGLIGWMQNDNSIEIDISSGSYKCFKNEGVTQKSVTCKEVHKILYTNALSFNSISQKLLFKGKSKDFSAYKER